MSDAPPRLYPGSDELLRELRYHERNFQSRIHGPLCGQAADEIERLRGVAQTEKDPQTAFNLGFRAAGGGCYLPPSAEALFQSWLRDGASQAGREPEEEIPASSPAQGPMDPATIEACAKIAENNGWEATAAQIRALALPSTMRCTCAAIVNPNIPHSRTCPLSSTKSGGAA